MKKFALILLACFACQLPARAGFNLQVTYNGQVIPPVSSSGTYSGPVNFPNGITSGTAGTAPVTVIANSISGLTIQLTSGTLQLSGTVAVAASVPWGASGTNNLIFTIPASSGTNGGMMFTGNGPNGRPSFDPAGNVGADLGAINQWAVLKVWILNANNQFRVPGLESIGGGVSSMVSNGGMGWTNSASVDSNPMDTAFFRSSAGVIDLTTGTAVGAGGTFGGARLNFVAFGSGTTATGTFYAPPGIGGPLANLSSGVGDPMDQMAWAVNPNPVLVTGTQSYGGFQIECPSWTFWNGQYIVYFDETGSYSGTAQSVIAYATGPSLVSGSMTYSSTAAISFTSGTGPYHGYIKGPRLFQDNNGLWYIFGVCGANLGDEAPPDCLFVTNSSTSPLGPWTLPAAPIITASGTGWKSFNVYRPMPIYVNGQLRVYYNASNAYSGSLNEQIGYAYYTGTGGYTNPASWVDYSGNPVITNGTGLSGTYDSQNMYDPQIQDFTEDSGRRHVLLMKYSAVSLSHGVLGNAAVAKSYDGIHWVKLGLVGVADNSPPPNGWLMSRGESHNIGGKEIALFDASFDSTGTRYIFAAMADYHPEVSTAPAMLPVIQQELLKQTVDDIPASGWTDASNITANGASVVLRTDAFYMFTGTATNSIAYREYIPDILGMTRGTNRVLNLAAPWGFSQKIDNNAIMSSTNQFERYLISNSTGTPQVPTSYASFGFVFTASGTAGQDAIGVLVNTGTIPITAYSLSCPGIHVLTGSFDGAGNGAYFVDGTQIYSGTGFSVNGLQTPTFSVTLSNNGGTPGVANILIGKMKIVVPTSSQF